jgi:hypothetical protein
VVQTERNLWANVSGWTRDVQITATYHNMAKSCFDFSAFDVLSF